MNIALGGVALNSEMCMKQALLFEAIHRGCHRSGFHSKPPQQPQPMPACCLPVRRS
jgi:hypothetical protein